MSSDYLPVQIDGDEIIADPNDPFFTGMTVEEAEHQDAARTAALVYAHVAGLQEMLTPQVRGVAFDNALQSVLRGLAQEGWPPAEPGDDLHTLLRYEEGDGWNEPMHEEFYCSCRKVEFSNWTQDSREYSGPKAQDVLDAYIAHRREVAGE